MDVKPWINSYKHAKRRCNNPKHEYYKWYGGRGIKFLLSRKEIETIWFRDKAYLLKNPSLDRKDNKGNYEFNNCRFIEMDINRIKDRLKPISQFDSLGNFIKEWNSAKEIELQLNIDNSSISKCCKGKRPFAGGFRWKYSS